MGYYVDGDVEPELRARAGARDQPKHKLAFTFFLSRVSIDAFTKTSTKIHASNGDVPGYAHAPGLLEGGNVFVPKNLTTVFTFPIM